MEEVQKYNLEKRTLDFARAIRDFIKIVPKTISNLEYSKQLIRSSASVGANYVEAGQSAGKKEFRIKIGISRKEAKESNYWLELIESDLPDRLRLLNESL